MTDIDFITELFVKVDDKLTKASKHHKHLKAKLYPSEVVTIALLFALKGVGTSVSTIGIPLSGLLIKIVFLFCRHRNGSSLSSLELNRNNRLNVYPCVYHAHLMR